MDALVFEACTKQELCSRVVIDIHQIAGIKDLMLELIRQIDRLERKIDVVTEGIRRCKIQIK